MKAKITKGGKTKKYNVIESWEDLTLEKWQKLVLSKKESKAKETQETISLFSDIPKKLIAEMSLKDAAVIFELISKIQIKGKLKKIFKIDGIEYGFLPDLDEITLGEYADIEQYIKNGYEANMHKIMSILFRPVTSKEGKLYSIEAYTDGRERAEKFKKKMDAEQVQQSLVFFWNLGNELVQTFPQYLERKLMEIRKEIASTKSGVGSE